VPYVKNKREELKLSSTQPAIVLFDVFKGQLTSDIVSLLEDSNIYLVKIPANCTDRLQPMDFSVNKAAKEFMRKKFSEWYSTEVQKQLEKGAKEISPVDLRMSIMKPLGAQWLVSLYDYLKEHSTIISNGFKAAGITQI
jgi:hypothetical protein